ncbi:MAG: hypothetical protein ACOCP8_01360 [archaeon]
MKDFNINNVKPISTRVDKILDPICPDAPKKVRDRIISLAVNVSNNDGKITDITITKITHIVVNIFYISEESKRLKEAL